MFNLKRFAVPLLCTALSGFALAQPPEFSVPWAGPVGNECHDPSLSDRWILEDMRDTHGIGTYKFSYWNSVYKCSDNTDRTIATEDGEFKVRMVVETLGSQYDDKERITIYKEGWIIEPRNLLLHDSNEAGVIWILFPGS